MDINQLQEQYHCLKEKQKLQTHVIVFKSGEDEAIPKESMVNAVLINKSKKKALKEREIKLDLPCCGNAQENSPWRIHLGIHRLAHHWKRPCDIVPNQNGCSALPCKESLESTEQVMALSSKEERDEHTVSSNSPRTSVTSLWTYSSLNIAASKPVPSKLGYYPFPQKKNPKISEAARKLGLYVSQ